MRKTKDRAADAVERSGTQLAEGRIERAYPHPQVAPEYRLHMRLLPIYEPYHKWMSRFLILIFIFAVFACEKTVFCADDPLVTERFWSILLKNPKRGTTLDRVCDTFVNSGQEELLLQKTKALTQNEPENAKVWLLAGLIHEKQGNDQPALEAYQKAVMLDMSDAIAPWYLGEMFLQKGELDRAIASLEQAQSRDPHRKDLLEIMQSLGRAYERNHRRDLAAKVWKELEALFPDDTEIIARIAEILEEERQYDQALDRYERLARLSQKSGEPYAHVRYAMDAAELKIKLGKDQEALTDYETLLDILDDQNWLVGVIRDRIERHFFQTRDVTGLVGYYENRRKQNPNDLETVRRLAAALVRIDNLGEAKAVLQEALEKAPSDVSLRQTLIDLYLRDDQFDLVDQEYEKLDALEPNHPDHITSWGLAALTATADEERAAQIWSKLLMAYPNDPSMFIHVADLMDAYGMADRAEKLYRDAIALAPDDVAYLEYLAMFYRRTGQKGKSVATFAKMTDGERRTADNLFRLARTLLRVGYPEEALAVIREGVALDPGHFEMQRTFLELLIDSRLLEEAREQLVRIEKRSLTDEQFRDTVALEIRLLRLSDSDIMTETIQTLTQKAAPTARDFWKTAMFQLQSGQIDAAIDSMEKAMPSAPDSVLIRETTADLLAKNFQPEKAIALYETLITRNRVHQAEYLKRIARIRLSTSEREHGVETLRRIVHNNPADLESLNLLVEQLCSTDQTEEAIALTWTAFEKVSDLQEKIRLAMNLAAYHGHIKQMDRLLNRLQENGDDPAKHHESVYCLTVVHLCVKDYLAARNTLETLLDATRKAGQSDPSLLQQLSVIAEMQGDLASAIRYQERFCETNRFHDGDNRLFDLYTLAGESEKSLSILDRRVISPDDLGKWIDTLDRLLAEEHYAMADSLLKRLETTFSDRWELLYRKLQLAYWLGEEDPEGIAETILGMNLPWDEPAAQWKKTEGEAGSGTNLILLTATQTGIGENVSHWSFGGQSDTVFYLEPGSPKSYFVFQNESHRLLQTLFREQLQLKKQFASREKQDDKTRRKPLFKPVRFADAGFAAMGWKMKIIVDRNFVDHEKGDLPVEDLLESANRLIFLVEGIRETLPVESRDPAVLRERLRFEFFWGQWIFESVMGNLPFSQYYLSLSDQKQWNVIQRLEVQLALCGEKEYDRSAFRRILESVEAELQLEFYQRAEVIAKINGTSLAYQNQLHTIESRMAMHPGDQDVDHRLGWLVEKLLEIGRTDPEQITKMPFHYSSLTNGFPVLYNLLKMKGRDADIDRIEKMLRSVGDTGSYFITQSLPSGREYALEQDWLQKVGLAPDTIFENPPPYQLRKR